MFLIDTHTHLYLPAFDNDRSRVVESAIQAGVVKMFLPNIDASTIEPMLLLSGQYPDHCYPMIGLHPSSVKEDYETQLHIIKDRLKEGLFIAVGEIGIDLYRHKTYQKQQTEVFRQQVQWAVEYQLPVVIHSRESLQEIFPVLDDFGNQSVKGVLHSFTGNAEEAEYAINKGFKLGVGGIITFKNSNLKNVISHIGPEHLVLETDAPFLAPVPRRGKRNESRYLIYVADFLAVLFHTTRDDIALITTNNALNLFQLNYDRK